MNKKYIFIALFAVIIILGLIVYWIFIRPNPEIEKAIKSLNSQNWDVAISKMKEVLFEDENNIEAKAILIYANYRKYCEENKLTDFEKVIENSFANVYKTKLLYFQDKLNERGFLDKNDKESFIKESKKIRKYLSQFNVTTDDIKDVFEIAKIGCRLGVDNLKLLQGDDVDEALFSYLLAGNSFFGDKKSGQDLIKLAKLNEKAQIMFLLCGTKFIDDIKKEAENDQSLFGRYAKSLVISSLMRDQINSFFNDYPRLESALSKLAEIEFEPMKEKPYLYNFSFDKNKIFYNENLFDDFLKILEKNNKAGLDVDYLIEDDLSLISFYGYDPKSKKFITRLYSFNNKEISKIEFKESDKKYFEFQADSSIYRLDNFNLKKNEITICLDNIKYVDDYEYEVRWNPKKYYSRYLDEYSGGYEYVEVPYKRKEFNSEKKVFVLNNSIADLIRTE